jgi:hypothetical protein
MPPRWPRKPSRQDPDFRKLDDRYTFAGHVAVFVTAATSLEFFNLLWRAHWPWLGPLLGWWAVGLGIHAFWILVIARYPAAPFTSEVEPIEADPTPD